jgi:hypothetical protein
MGSERATLSVILAAAIIGLIIVHGRIGREWLVAYVARYKKAPGRGWMARPDPDPAIERLRRRRLAVALPMIGLLIVNVIVLLAPR